MAKSQDEKPKPPVERPTPVQIPGRHPVFDDGNGKVAPSETVPEPAPSKDMNKVDD